MTTLSPICSRKVKSWHFRIKGNSPSHLANLEPMGPQTQSLLLSQTDKARQQCFLVLGPISSENEHIAPTYQQSNTKSSTFSDKGDAHANITISYILLLLSGTSGLQPISKPYTSILSHIIDLSGNWCGSVISPSADSVILSVLCPQTKHAPSYQFAYI